MLGFAGVLSAARSMAGEVSNKKVNVRKRFMGMN